MKRPPLPYGNPEGGPSAVDIAVIDNEGAISDTTLSVLFSRKPENVLTSYLKDGRCYLFDEINFTDTTGSIIVWGLKGIDPDSGYDSITIAVDIIDTISSTTRHFLAINDTVLLDSLYPARWYTLSIKAYDCMGDSVERRLSFQTQNCFPKDMIFIPRFPENGIHHPFWIAPTELTIGEYAAVTGKSLHDAAVMYNNIVQTSDDTLKMLPMISGGESTFRLFFESINKTNNLNNGTGFRFATNVEWGHACRNPDSSTQYFWGNQSFSEVVKQYAWYCLNADSTIWTIPHATYSGPQPVALLKPNAFGLYDLYGNVNELVMEYRPGYDTDYLSGKIYWAGGNIYCTAKELTKTYGYYDNKDNIPIIGGTRKAFGYIE